VTDAAMHVGPDAGILQPQPVDARRDHPDILGREVIYAALQLRRKSSV
jgi:hypothetical protein